VDGLAWGQALRWGAGDGDQGFQLGVCLKKVLHLREVELRAMFEEGVAFAGIPTESDGVKDWHVCTSQTPGITQGQCQQMLGEE